MSEITKMVWSKGGSVSIEQLSEFGGVDDTWKKEEICENYYLKAELRGNITCRKCEGVMKSVKSDTILVCPSCNNIIDVERDQYSYLFWFTPDFTRISQHILQALTEKGIPPVVGKKHSEIDHLFEICTFSFENSLPYRLYLAESILDISPVSLLWTDLFISNEYAIVLHPGLSESVENLLSLTVSSAPIIFSDLDSIGENDFLKNVERFDTFIQQVSDLVDFFLAHSQKLQTSEEKTKVKGLPYDIDNLARAGREKFEAPAMNLLNTIGVSYPLDRHKYYPDGFLMLKDSFWIVDAKSSGKGFQLEQSERDKTDRYRRIIELELESEVPNWRFMGELVVTKTSHIDKRLIDRLRLFFDNSDLHSTVSLVSYEGLYWLWNQAYQDPKYWHLINFNRDVLKLLDLHQVIIKGVDTNDPGVLTSRDKLKVISESVIKSFWKYIVQRDEYDTLGMASPEHWRETIQRIYMERFTQAPT